MFRSVLLRTAELHLSGRWLSGSPIIRIGLALRIILSRILQNYLVLKLLVIGLSTVQCYGFYSFKSGVVERFRKHVRTVNSNSRTSNRQCSLFVKNNPIIRIFCLSGWLAVPINPDKWSSIVFILGQNIFPGVLFTNAPKLRPSFNMKDQVPHPCTRIKIIRGLEL